MIKGNWNEERVSSQINYVTAIGTWAVLLGKKNNQVTFAKPSPVAGFFANCLVLNITKDIRNNSGAYN